MDFLTFSWQMLVILLLVGANGFFVASEFAIVKIRATQLKPLLKTGDWRVPLASRVVQRLDAYLSATQLGITLSSLVLGWLGKPYLAHWVELVVRDFGVTSPRVLGGITFAIAFGIITFLHIVLGELAPKSLAIQKPKAVTLWVAAPLIFFYYLFFPFIWFLNGTANLMLKSIGIQPAGEGDHAISSEELQYVLAHSSHVHPSDEYINKIMLKAIRLKETTAEQVMLPREKVDVLRRDLSLAENIVIAQRTGHSRLPLCGKTLDEVLGVVHIKELLWQIHVLGDQTKLESLVRPVLTFLPKTKLPTMLELFRQSRNHLAVVLDAEDRMRGLVSFEDVLEELVGDIRDEFDIEKGPIFERTENSLLVDVELPLRDLASEMGWALPMGSNDTVEKWCMQRWGRVPARGESITVDSFVIKAEEVGLRGLRRVRVTKEKPHDVVADV